MVLRSSEITVLHTALSQLAVDLDAGETLDPAEQIHTLSAFAAALPADPEQQRALTAENEQLRRAIATRDIIGQAKGMLMERYDIDSAEAFRLLVSLSQQTNTRLEHVARRLVDVDHPAEPAIGA